MVTLEQDLELDLSRLRWIKVVTPFGNYEYRWAFSPKAITELTETYQAKIIDFKIDSKYRLTIFPLGFKREDRQEEIKCGDLIALTQRGKITHIVEVLDDKYYEQGEWSHGSKKGSWFNRYVKIVWWQPEKDWDELRERSKVLGFDINIYDGNPRSLTCLLQSSQEKSGNEKHRSFEDFQKELAGELQK